MNRPSPRFLADCHTFGQTFGEPFSATDPAQRQPGQPALPLWLQAACVTPWPSVMGMLAALAAFALLLAFSQVVSDGVQQGALRRSTLASQALPAWHCDTSAQQLLCVAGSDNRAGKRGAPQVRVSVDTPAGVALASH